MSVFSADVAELHPLLLAAAGGRDVRVAYGGRPAAQFVLARLVDEIVVTHAPCSPGSGGLAFDRRQTMASHEFP